MTARMQRNSQPVVMPTPVDIGEPFSVGIACYRTDKELMLYLRALQNYGNNQIVVVLGLQPGVRIATTDLPTNARLIMTSAERTSVDEQIGWFVPDPFQAVVVGMTGRQPNEGLILLFPESWQGESPEDLVDRARRWRSGPHSSEDDIHFAANLPQ